MNFRHPPRSTRRLVRHRKLRTPEWVRVISADQLRDAVAAPDRFIVRVMHLDSEVHPIAFLDNIKMRNGLSILDVAFEHGFCIEIAEVNIREAI